MGKILALAVGPVLKAQLMPEILRQVAGKKAVLVDVGRKDVDVPRGRARVGLQNTNTKHDHEHVLSAARTTAAAAALTFQALLYMEHISTRDVARVIRESATGYKLAAVFDWPQVLIGDSAIFWPTTTEN